MFCMHCGKPTEGDQLVCPQCAAQQAAQQAPQAPVEPAPQPVFEQPAPQQPVFEQPAPQQPVFEQPAPQQPVFEQPAPQQPVFEQPVYQQPVYQQPAPQPAPQQDTFVLNTPETAGKKKKKNKLLTGIIALVTAAAVVVGGIIGWPYIANFFKKTTSTPQDYNKDTITSTVADADGALITTYSALRDLLTSGIDPTNAAAEAAVRLKIDEDLLKSILGPVLADAPIDPEDLACLSDISVKLDYNAKDGGFELTAIPVLGDTELVTIEAGADLEDGLFWFRLPELSDEYVTGEFDPSDLGLDMDEMQAAFATVGQVAEILPEEEVVVRLLEKYIPLALGEIDDVKEKDTKLEAGGIEQSVTAVTSGISQKTAIKMVKACLKEVQKDKDIKAILEDMSIYLTGGSTSGGSQILDQIPDLIEQLDENLEDADDEAVFKLTTYVDSKGALKGLSLEMDGMEMATAYSVSKGDDFACVVEVPEADLYLTGEGADKGGIINAIYTLEFQGTELGTVELNNFDSKGMTKGTIIITPSDELFELMGGNNAAVSVLASAGMSLEVSFETGKDEGSCAIALLAKGEDMLRLSVDSQLKKPTAVQAQTGGIDFNDDEAGMNWVMGWDYEAVLDNLRDGGVPGELVDMLQQALEQGLSQSETDTQYPEYDEEMVGTGGFIEEEYEFNSTGKVVD